MTTLPMEVVDFPEGTVVYEVMEKSTESCHVSFPLEKADRSTSEKPSLPTSTISEPSDPPITKSTIYVLFAVLFTFVLLAIFLVSATVTVAVFHVQLRAEFDATKASYEENFRQLNASIQVRIDEAVLELSLNITRLVHAAEGSNGVIANISLLDITKLENLATVLNHIERIDSSLQGHMSSTNTALAILHRHSEELARNITSLEDTAESIDTRIINVAAETRRNVTIFTNSLASFSDLLAELAVDTSRNLDLVNSSLHQEIQVHLERLTDEAHGLVNRSTAEVFEHIENEIMEVRRHIDTQVSEVRGHVDTQVSKVKENITQLEDATENVDTRLVNFAADTRRNATTFTNSLANLSSDLQQLAIDTSRNLSLVNSSLTQGIQVLSESLTTFRVEARSLVNRSATEVLGHIESEIMEVRGHIDTRVSEVRGHVDTQVSEVRGHIDSQVSEVREHSDSQDSEVREYITDSIDEVRRQVNREITEDVDDAVAGVRQYVDTEIRHVNDHIDTEIFKLKNAAISLQSSGLLVTLLLGGCMTLICNIT